MRPASSFACAALLVFAACSQTPPYQAHQITGHMPRAIRESSGIAASHRDPRLFWTHNDSGGQPVLYGIEANGAQRGDLRLAGLKNTDWEDIASFELDGQAWILVADTGDNRASRHDCALYVVAEPDPARLVPLEELSVPVAWKIPVRYLDGPHDCESVAVDAKAGLVYLLTKREKKPVLLTLPLRPTSDPVGPAATPVARLHDFPLPSALQRLLPVPSGSYRAEPTAMDFSPDGSMAAVLTYGNVCLFPRQAGESWTTALSRKPEVLPPHGLAQAEGVCFARDGRTIYVTSEGADSPILRYLPAR